MPFPKSSKQHIKMTWLKVWPHTIITIVILVFFVRLLFPPSFFITPDFAGSDLLHINLPVKYIVSQSLKTHTLPMWEDSTAQGYPFLAEGINGIFFIPNFFIFLILPFKLAIPVMYIVTFLISALGSYLLLKTIKLDRYSSVFGSISFAFSAAMILRISHIGVLQSVAMLPLVLTTFLRFANYQDKKRATILVLALSQLFLTGYFQLYVYAVLLFASIAVVHKILISKDKTLRFICALMFLTVLSLGVSSIQLVPTIELTNYSARESGIDPSIILKSFPLNPKNFLTYLNPSIAGTASDGSYNSLYWDKFGIYWENTAYIGVLPLAFALFAILRLIKKGRINFYLIIFAALILTVLLALGKYSPLHFFFSLPPLNMFRVPARFIIFTQLFLVILASYGISTIFNKIRSHRKAAIVFVFLIALTTFDLFFNWWHYHPIAKASDVLSKPDTARQFSEPTANYRIISLQFGKNWNEVFVTSGWKNKEDDYLFFGNSLNPNYNSLFNLNNIQGYQVLSTRRYELQKDLIEKYIKNSDNSIDIQEKGIDILSNLSVKYFISPVPIENNKLKKISEIEKEKYKYIIYENTQAEPLNKIYFKSKEVKTVADYFPAFENNNVLNTALVESPVEMNNPQENYDIKVVSNTKTSKVILTNSNHQGIFVLSESYYKGWKAKLDGKETELFPANINSRAIILPEGNHKVESYYDPTSLKIGALISFLSIIITFSLLYKKPLWKLKVF